MRVTGGQLADTDRLTNYRYTRKGGWHALRADGALYSGGRNTRYAKSWHAPRAKLAPATAPAGVAGKGLYFDTPASVAGVKPAYTCGGVRVNRKGVKLIKK